MALPTTSSRFLTVLKFNLGLAGILALLGGFLESIRLIFENQIPAGSYLNLVLFLVNQAMTQSFLIAVVMSLFLSLTFGFFGKKFVNPCPLIFKESVLVIILIAVITIIKKYFPDLLGGRFAYFAFILSHWVKENAAVLIIIFLFAWLLTFLAQRFKRFSVLLSPKTIGLAFLVLFTLRIVSWAYGQSLQLQLKHRDAPSIILLTVDTLRADHMSLYGYFRETTPHLNRFAKEGMVFQNAMAPWTKTNQSFAGIFSGKYCYAAGIGRAVASSLPRYNFLLSEILKNAGYRTAAIVSNANLSGYFYFNDGFDDFIELWQKQKGPAREEVWYKADRVTSVGIEWLRNHRSDKFFLWIHYIDPHTVYDPPPPYLHMFEGDAHYDRNEEIPLEKIDVRVRIGAERDPDLYIARYDGAVRYTDDQIHLFLDELEKLGLKDKTLVVFTSDHGESFVDNHLYFQHGRYTYENCARVPLIIRYPRTIGSSRIYADVVSLIDIYPTVLGLLGLPQNQIPIQGKNLEPFLGEGKANLSPYVLIESNHQVAIRTNQWKLIYANKNDEEKEIGNPFWELFNLETDRGEKINLSGKGLNEEKKLKEILLSQFGKAKHNLSLQHKNENPDVDPASLEQLKTLGYIQ